MVDGGQGGWRTGGETGEGTGGWDILGLGRRGDRGDK